MLRFLVTSIGSLGEIRPMLAIADALKELGHTVVFGATNRYRALASSFEFHSLGPDEYFDDQDLRRSISSPINGSDIFIRKSNLESFDSILTSLDKAAEQADALVCSVPTVMGAHIVAQQRRLPLIGCVVSPGMLRQMPSATRSDFIVWRRTLNDARQKRGLPRLAVPQLEVYMAPDLMIGMYPAYLRSNDAQSVREPEVLGYPNVPPLSGERASSELLAWMRTGPFAVFSFGSYTELNAGEMFEIAVAACKAVGLRCLYLSAGLNGADLCDSDTRVERFVSHEAVFDEASLIVHHAGSGTLVAASESRAATICTPFAHDQVYNAARMQEQDLAEVLMPQDWSVNSLIERMRAAMRLRDVRRKRLRMLSRVDQQSAQHVIARRIEALTLR